MRLSPENLVHLACLWEATVRKPGNVHPEASFPDLRYRDFVLSAEAASPWLAQAGELGVGASIEQAVRATRRQVQTNTNLGIVLLIAPLAAVPLDEPLVGGIVPTLASTTVADAVAVYRAIRLAAPGGLGRVDRGDLRDEPTEPLTVLMGLAANRDRVARQYVTDFADVLRLGVATLDRWLTATDGEAETSLIGLHLSLLAEFPDSLIARKCGDDIAREASQRAREVLERGWPMQADGAYALACYDDWLRGDGHRRNPGTTADLVAATLYAHLRERARQGLSSPYFAAPPKSP